MQLRHCCNHPFLIKVSSKQQVVSCTLPHTSSCPSSHFFIKGVVEAEGMDYLDDNEWLEKLISSSGKLVLLDKLLPRLQVEKAAAP